MVYFALAQSVLSYSIIVWRSAYQNVLEPLNETHNIIMLIRVMMNNLLVNSSKL